MVLSIIGIGLSDEKDITLKGLELVKKADFVYLESYTSKLSCSISKLEKLYGKKVILADRDMVENKTEIIDNAVSKNVCFLVIGDVFSATTHVDIMQRALDKKIKVNVVHNTSVLTAIGSTGLSLYKFGQTTSIPFDNKNVKSPVNVLLNNQKIGLHTLFLFDLDPLSDKFMNVKEAVSYLLDNGVKDQLAVACCGLGFSEQVIKVGKLKELSKVKFDVYPQCLIIPGKLHFTEEEFLENFKLF
jgi:diphthine methyl ester synthase